MFKAENWLTVLGYFNGVVIIIHNNLPLSPLPLPVMRMSDKPFLSLKICPSTLSSLSPPPPPPTPQDAISLSTWPEICFKYLTLLQIKHQPNIESNLRPNDLQKDAIIERGEGGKKRIILKWAFPRMRTWRHVFFTRRNGRLIPPFWHIFKVRQATTKNTPSQTTHSSYIQKKDSPFSTSLHTLIPPPPKTYQNEDLKSHLSSKSLGSYKKGLW